MSMRRTSSASSSYSCARARKRAQEYDEDAELVRRMLMGRTGHFDEAGLAETGEG